jgi:hypothetical protein
MTEVSLPTTQVPEWARARSRTLAAAVVVQWNDSIALVACPYPSCRKIHCHGSERAREGYPTSRLSHCDKLQQEYQLIWPFCSVSIAQDLGLGCELDRKTGDWRTIGSYVEDSGIEESLAEFGLEHTRFHSGEDELVDTLDHLSLEDQSYNVFISLCVSNDVKEVESCLDSKDLSESYLENKNSEGNVALTLVCMEGHLDIIRLLVERGSPIDSRNKKGETPLIISLQYGKIEVATYLVYRGASIESRDTQGISVLSHTRRLLQRLEDTRILCIDQTFNGQNTTPKMETVADKVGKVVMTYFEDPNPSIGMRNRDHQEKIDRTQLIVNFCMAHENLQNCVEKQRRNRTRNIRPSKISISRCATKTMITVFRDVYHIPMIAEQKTFAYLERGDGLDYVFAISGWSGGQFANIDGCIDRELWTKRVFEFSKIIGHKLDHDKKDSPDRKGSYHACHAEKQLMAYVLWHYTSLQIKPNQEAPEAEWAGYKRVDELHQCIWEATDYVAACVQPCERYRGPPVGTVKLIIHITNDVCHDCSNFRERVKLYTGIDISLERL